MNITTCYTKELGENFPITIYSKKKLVSYDEYMNGIRPQIEILDVVTESGTSILSDVISDSVALNLIRENGYDE